MVQITVTQDDRQGLAPVILYLNRSMVFAGNAKQLDDWLDHQETSIEKYQYDGMRGVQTNEGAGLTPGASLR